MLSLHHFNLQQYRVSFYDSLLTSIDFNEPVLVIFRHQMTFTHMVICKSMNDVMRHTSGFAQLCKGGTSDQVSTLTCYISGKHLTSVSSLFCFTFHGNHLLSMMMSRINGTLFYLNSHLYFILSQRYASYLFNEESSFKYLHIL